MECKSCKKEVKEVCDDGFCRKCHIDLTFEDCCDGTWTAKLSLRNGRSIEEATTERTITHRLD
jgi:hypothetical protein